MAPNENIQSSMNEKRLWNIIMAACFALGGWWLQNQYDTTLELQKQFYAYQQFVDTHYVEKEFLAQVTNERERRLTSIETKLDTLLRRQLEQAERAIPNNTGGFGGGR